MPGKDKVLRWTRAWVGPYDLSGDARTVGTLMNGIEEIVNTGWDDEYHNYIGSDQRMHGVEGFQAMLDDGALKSFPLLSAQSENEIAFLFGSGGEPDVGDAAYMMPAVQLMDDSAFDSGLGVLNANFKADADQYDDGQYNPLGRVLHDKSRETASVNGPSYDWGASGASGGWGMLLVYNAGGNWTIKIQDSLNNTTFADLITFAANGSTVVGESRAVSGTVQRYTRIQYTRTSGRLDAVCLFALNK